MSSENITKLPKQFEGRLWNISDPLLSPALKLSIRKGALNSYLDKVVNFFFVVGMNYL